KEVDPWSGIFHAAGILGHGNDLEILVSQLLVECLPAWQVKAAASPGGPGDKQNFLAAKIRERVWFAVDIRQCEVRRAQRSQSLALVRTQAEVPGGGREVMRYRLADQGGKGCEIEPGLAGLAVEEFLLARLGQRETQLIAANALWLELEAGGAGQVGRADSAPPR